MAPSGPPGPDADQAASRWIQGQLSQVPGRRRAGCRPRTSSPATAASRSACRTSTSSCPGGRRARPRAASWWWRRATRRPGSSAGTTATAVMLAHGPRLGDLAPPAPAPVRLDRRQHDRQRRHPLVPRAASRRSRSRRPSCWTPRARPRATRSTSGATAAPTGRRCGWASCAERSIGAGRRAQRGRARRWGSSSCTWPCPRPSATRAPPIADGLPAVTLSGRGESPLRPGRQPTADRMALVGQLGQRPAADARRGGPGARRRTAASSWRASSCGPPSCGSRCCCWRCRSSSAPSTPWRGMRRAKVSLLDGLRAIGLRTAPLARGPGGRVPPVARRHPAAHAAGAPPLPAGRLASAPAAGLGLVLSVGGGRAGVALGAAAARAASTPRRPPRPPPPWGRSRCCWSCSVAGEPLRAGHGAARVARGAGRHLGPPPLAGGGPGRGRAAAGAGARDQHRRAARLEPRVRRSGTCSRRRPTAPGARGARSSPA